MFLGDFIFYFEVTHTSMSGILTLLSLFPKRLLKEKIYDNNSYKSPKLNENVPEDISSLHSETYVRVNKHSRICSASRGGHSSENITIFQTLKDLKCTSTIVYYVCIRGSTIDYRESFFPTSNSLFRC